MLALMMCAMTGTLFVYQGQEIGMINTPKDWTIKDYKDIESINYYQSVAKRTDNRPSGARSRHEEFFKSSAPIMRDCRCSGMINPTRG